MQPPAYNRAHDFDADEPDNTNGQAINNEFDGVAQSIKGIRDNLAKLQRDDGGLANGIVTEDSLAPDLKEDLFNTFSQDINDKVLEAAQAANDATNAAIAAGQSASSAASSRDASVGAAATAVAAAQAAGASQNAAAGSATAAAASATMANTSATNAGVSATSAQGDAQTANAAAGTANTAAASAILARNDAQAAATAAASSEANAADSETLARAWAAQESGPVADGLLSARRYAELAAAGAGLPIYSTIPSTDNGPIWVIAVGPMQWNSALSMYMPVLRFAECRLDGGSVANSIVLSRASGSRLTAGNTTLVIPETGLQVALTGLAASTLYHVFGYDNVGALAIEYGTGAAWNHAADPQTGMHVKFNTSTNAYDRSRTYLGMFFCNGVGQVVDNQTQRGVASFYNRVQKFAFASNPAMATSSTTFVQGSGVGCLVWAAGSIATSLFGTAYSNANFGMNRACLGISNSPIVPITADAQSTVPNHYVQLAQSWMGLANTDGFIVLQYLLCTGSAGAVTTHSGSVNIGVWI